MSRRLLVNARCPLCGDHVEEVPPTILMKNPDRYDVELVVTKRGLKQYLHTSCWNAMIKEKSPYTGKMYV